MKAAFLAALPLLLLALPAAAQRICDQATPFKYSAATGPIEIVPGIPDQRIYLCGFMLADKGNTLDFQISTGQGVNCATNATALTPQISIPNDTVFVNRIEHVGPNTPLGNALCVQTFGAGELTGAIYWTQF